MKISNFDELIHILDNHSNVWSVIKTIANSCVQEDAFYICDIGSIVRKHKLWTSLLPRVDPHYAVKCNDSLIVLEVLAALGTGFDCASKVEINKILSMGINPDRIIFANPAKPSSFIRQAASVGVSKMTFDNETELHKVKALYPDSKMVIRIRCDASQAQCELGMKFGCDPITEAPQLLGAARSLGLDVIGVSFHVGSGCQEPQVFYRAIKAAREVFDFAATLGFDFYLLDIGGGYPGNNNALFEEIAGIINKSLDKYFPDPTTEIIAEPGRFFVSSAYTLACNIHSVRSTAKIDNITGTSKKHYMYYINDGVYGSFNCILYDHQVVVPQTLEDYCGRKYQSSSIWGPTCDGLDQVCDDVLLPEMKVGEWLVFENMGAYTLPVASSFNGFPIPKVHVVADENVWKSLKNVLPLTEEHFIMGNPTPIMGRGLDITSNDISLVSLPIEITVPCYGENSLIENRVLGFIDIGPEDETIFN